MSMGGGGGGGGGGVLGGGGGGGQKAVSNEFTWDGFEESVEQRVHMGRV